MAGYKTPEEFLKAVQSLVGDRSDDDTLEIIGNLTDTYNDMSNKDKENWKQKYEENDKEWRRKYKERFFTVQADDNNDLEDATPEQPKKQYLFSNLFKEGE